MNLSKDIKLLITIGVLNSLIWIIFIGVVETNDSSSYYNAWTNLSNSTVDIYRTPSYPIFLGVLNLLFGSHYKFFAILFQHGLFLISSIYFYKSLAFFVNNDKIVLWSSILYILCPALVYWNNAILTESLSISGMCFLIYCFILLREKYNFCRYVFFFGWLLFLVMLRPSFLYLLLVFGAYWVIILVKRNYTKAVVGLCGITILSGLFYLYILSFQKEYGVLTPTCVSDINRYVISRQYKLLEAQEISDQQLRQDVSAYINEERLTRAYSLWEETNSIFAKHDIKLIDEALNASVHAKPFKYFLNIIVRFYKASGYVYVFYVLLFLYFIILLSNAIMTKKIPTMSVILFSIGLLNLLVVLIGSLDCHGRLNISVFSIYIIMIAQLVANINRETIKKIEFV